ncbi:hypothetical protein AtEden1_Chr5g0134151 [Arabidopsis thaliana]
MTKSISEGKTQFFSPAISSTIDPADEHIGHSPDDMKIIFCQQCAFHCIEKKKNIAYCENSICRCTLEDIFSSLLDLAERKEEVEEDGVML